jgi:hypothetical protein
MSISCDLLLATLAFDGERSLCTISRTEPRRLDVPELVEWNSSLLLDLDVGRGARNPFAVGGLESLFWGEADRRETERRIHDGDNRSIVEGGSVDMTSSDIE